MLSPLYYVTWFILLTGYCDYLPVPIILFYIMSSGSRVSHYMASVTSWNEWFSPCGPWASPGNLFETQILRPTPDLLNLGLGVRSAFKQPMILNYGWLVSLESWINHSANMCGVSLMWQVGYDFLEVACWATRPCSCLWSPVSWQETGIQPIIMTVDVWLLSPDTGQEFSQVFCF